MSGRRSPGRRVSAGSCGIDSSQARRARPRPEASSLLGYRGAPTLHVVSAPDRTRLLLILILKTAVVVFDLASFRRTWYVIYLTRELGNLRVGTTSWRRAVWHELDCDV